LQARVKRVGQEAEAGAVEQLLLDWRARRDRAALAFQVLLLNQESTTFSRNKSMKPSKVLWAFT
jgi:hypothetical protein